MTKSFSVRVRELRSGAPRVENVRRRNMGENQVSVHRKQTDFGINDRHLPLNYSITRRAILRRVRHKRRLLILSWFCCRKTADVTMDGQFLVRQIYDDEITYNLVASAAEILSESVVSRRELIIA